MAKPLKEYIKSVQKQVGWAKAGFAKALISLGGAVPDWITRQGQLEAGGIIDGRDNPTGPQITVINKSAWAAGGEAQRIVVNAGKIRAGKMERRIKWLVEDAARKSGASVA